MTMRRGKELWRTRLNDVPSSAPISYMANGKQYVAMIVGNGGAQAPRSRRSCPEIRIRRIAAPPCGCSNCRARAATSRH